MNARIYMVFTDGSVPLDYLFIFFYNLRFIYNSAPPPLPVPQKLYISELRPFQLFRNQCWNVMVSLTPDKVMTFLLKESLNSAHFVFSLSALQLILNLGDNQCINSTVIRAIWQWAACPTHTLACWLDLTPFYLSSVWFLTQILHYSGNLAKISSYTPDEKKFYIMLKGVSPHQPSTWLFFFLNHGSRTNNPTGCTHQSNVAVSALWL